MTQEQRLQQAEKDIIGVDAHISSHELQCTERWMTARQLMEEVKSDIKEINKRIWLGAVGLISILLAMFGKLSGWY